MKSVRLRPVFSIPTNLESRETIERIRVAVGKNSSGLNGRFTKDHAMLTSNDSQRRFWSPSLHLEVQNSESGHRVVGRFSPHPSIWTAFMLAYLATAVLCFFSTIIGVSQVLARSTSWGFWLLPIWAMIGLCLWIVSQMGQRLAAEEMRLLQCFVQRTLED